MPRDPTPLRAGARGAEADAAEDAVDAANAAAAPGDKPPPPSPLAAALLATATKAHTLPDGRALSYVVCGAGAAAAAASDAVGTVLFLHPVQGNSLMALALHAHAARLGLRIVAPDRPGYRGSAPQSGRTVSDHVGDLAELLRALRVPRVAVLASSAGCMYAMAMARDERTRALVAGRVTLLPPWLPPASHPAGHRPALGARLLSYAPARALSALVSFANGFVLRRVVGAGATVASVMTRSTPLEVAAFQSDPDNESYYAAMISDWARPGAAAAIAEEMLLCAEAGAARRLGFSYLDAFDAGGKGGDGGGCDGVRVFAGAADAVAPLAPVLAWAEAARARGGGGSSGGGSGGGGGGGGESSSAVEVIVIEAGTHDGIVHTHKGAALEALAADLRAAAAAAGGGGGGRAKRR